MSHNHAPLQCLSSGQFPGAQDTEPQMPVQTDGPPDLVLGTLADVIVSMMHQLLEGGKPCPDDIVQVLKGVQEGSNIYQPLESTSRQLMQSFVDDEVSLALFHHWMGALSPNGFGLKRSRTAPADILDEAESLHTLQQINNLGGENGTREPTATAPSVDKQSHMTGVCCANEASQHSAAGSHTLSIGEALVTVISMTSPLETEQLSENREIALSGVARLVNGLLRKSQTGLVSSTSAMPPYPGARARRCSVSSILDVRGEVARSCLHDIVRHRSGPYSHQEKIALLQDASSSNTSDSQLLQTRPSSERTTPSGFLCNSVSSVSSYPSTSLYQEPAYTRSEDNVPPVAMLEVMQLLAAAEDWQWDVFSLAEATRGHALSTLGYYLFHHGNLISHFNISPPKLMRFLRRIEDGYRSNPYHNSNHVAGVLQTMHVLLHKGGIVPKYVALESLTLLASYLAAIVHDFEHKGVTTEFLINTNDPLAIRYNDKTPMENHHVAASFALLARPEYNFLDVLSKAQFATVRKLVIDLVLATDMKLHYPLISQFSTQLNISSIISSSPRSDEKNSHGGIQHPSPFDAASSAVQEGMGPKNDVQLLLSLQIALKCSDLGHTAASLPLHLKWVLLLQEELIQQGKQELQLRMPMSPMCEPADNQRLGKGQVVFFDLVVLPMLRAFTHAFPATTPQLTNSMRMRDYWAQGLDVDT